MLLLAVLQGGGSVEQLSAEVLEVMLLQDGMEVYVGIVSCCWCRH